MLGVMDESIIVRKGCLKITGGLGEGRRVFHWEGLAYLRYEGVQQQGFSRKPYART